MKPDLSPSEASFFHSPRISIIFDWTCRLSLGLIFAYAAAEKIAAPASFALAVDNYRLLPVAVIGPTAIILPWLELIAALGVLFGGPWKRPAALILAALLISFMLAVGFNLARGLNFECGCFGSINGGRRAGLTLLAQDAFLLICAAGLIWRPSRSFE